MPSKETDAKVAELEWFLDEALKQKRAGNDILTILALRGALAAAKALPQKKEDKR